MRKLALISLLMVTMVLAQTNPLVTIIRSQIQQKELYALATAYCTTKVKWDQLYYTITNMKSTLDSAKQSFYNLVALIEPGGALYNTIMTWSTNYQNGFMTLRNYALTYMINLQGLATAINAANAYLNSMYGVSTRTKLLANYRTQLLDIYNKMQTYLQQYMASEMMTEAAKAAQVVHYKEVFAVLNVTSVNAAVLNTLNKTMIVALQPAVTGAWLSLAACSTDFANNTFIECFTDINKTNIYGPIYMSFGANLPYNLYQLVYNPGLGATCPINQAQIHNFMVAIYNQYVTLYNYYYNNVMPWEVRLLSTQNVLVGIISTMTRDLLSPITSSINLLKSTATSQIISGCLNLATTPTTVNLQNLDIRNPTQVAGFLNNIATTLKDSYNNLYNALNCMNFYLPKLQVSVDAYLKALASRFKQLSGGVDIETWAQEHGIQCSYVPLTTPATTLQNIIQTYYNLLNPASPTSFINNINVTAPIGVVPPTSLSQGGYCG